MPKPPEPTPSVTLNVPGKDDGDDHVFVFRPGDVTPKIARRIRSETGMSILQAQRLLETDPDLDVLATICFAARLIETGTAVLADIEELLDYDVIQGIEMETPETDPSPAEDGDPEA